MRSAWSQASHRRPLGAVTARREPGRSGTGGVAPGTSASSGPPSSLFRSARSVAQRVEPLHDLAPGRRPDDAVLLRPVLEEDELRDRLDAEAPREPGMLIHVDLGDRHLIAELTGELVEQGSDGAAGAAPRRPEVH